MTWKTKHEDDPTELPPTRIFIRDVVVNFQNYLKKTILQIAPSATANTIQLQLSDNIGYLKRYKANWKNEESTFQLTKETISETQILPLERIIYNILKKTEKKKKVPIPFKRWKIDYFFMVLLEFDRKGFICA